MDLSNKRLLLMGATSMMATAVRTAAKHGIYTIVVDYNEDSPAKKIADKTYLVSTADTDALLEICKNEKVDGVFFGYSELNQYFTLDLTERAGYYNYATREQVDILANKANFKNCCRKYGVSCVPGFRLNKNLERKDIDNIEYPVIVKPVDSYSGKGISICNCEKELISAVPAAIKESKCGEFLVEKYMSENDYDVITAYYSIQDGNVVLSSMADRYMVDFENKRRLNTAILYPSQYLNRFIDEMNDKICNMLKCIGLKNGTLFLEGAVNDTGFYLWEAGYRLCGAQQNIFPSYINKVDIQEMLIQYSLTGKMAEQDMMQYEDPAFKGMFACNGLLFIRPGRISDIQGVDKVYSIAGVINFTQLLKEGDEIKRADIGTLNQSFARFHIVAGSKDALFEIITSINNTIAVLDENGENMLLQTFNFDEMYKDKRWI